MVVQGCAALLGYPEPALGTGLFVVLLMGMVLMGMLYLHRIFEHPFLFKMDAVLIT